MSQTAIVVIDVDSGHDLTGVKNAINGLVQRAKNSGQPFFYVIPEGTEIADEIDKIPSSSVLRYEDEENWYDDARIDEKITNRDIDKVVTIGSTSKESELVEKEQARGRSTERGNKK